MYVFTNVNIVVRKYISFETYKTGMANLFFMRRYYPDAEKVMLVCLRRGGFNLTDRVFEQEGDTEIDLRIRFGY